MDMLHIGTHRYKVVVERGAAPVRSDVSLMCGYPLLPAPEACI